MIIYNTVDSFPLIQKCLLFAKFQNLHTTTDTTQEENKSVKF